MIKRVYNKRLPVSIAGVPIEKMEKHISSHLRRELKPSEHVLRHAIVGVSGNDALVEMVIADAERELSIESSPNYHGPKSKKVVVHIIPTGVRASIGGYIADGNAVNNGLALNADYVITNPNTVNGAVINLMAPNVLYTEGHSLDNFFGRRIALRQARKFNRIGLLIDKAEDYEELRRFVFQTAEMYRLQGGINISPYIVTDEVVGSRSFQNESGAFSGEIGNPSTLIRGMEKLLKNRTHEIDVFAVATQIHIPEDALERYHRGEIPDPHGGLEAVTSHMLSWRSGKMVAHAPLLSREEIYTLLEMTTVEPRAAGEIIGGIGFLGCVFAGLSRAPNVHFLSRPNELLSPDWLSLDDVAVVVAPWNALGGYPMLVSAENDIPIIAVRDNTTVLEVTKESLHYGDHVISVNNYLEAMALVKRITRGENYRLSERETGKLYAEGCRIAEEAGMSLDALVRPVEPYETFAKG